MIQYSLKCEHGHGFDSWFKSSSAFDALKASGHVTCAFCGSAQVEKAIMAPRVRASRDAAPAQTPEQPAAPVVAESKRPMVTAPEAEMRKAMGELKKQVEANSDYVGGDFAKEARAMHLGEAPERAIYGEAKASDAKALLEDGVPVMPLPFTPTRKAN